MFGQSAGQYYYGDCVKFDGDAKNVVQPVADSHYGQSVVLNVKTRKLFVKLCNASDQAKTARLDLSRFKGMKKTAVKTTLSGQPNDENNYEQPPVVPVKETIKAAAKQTMTLQPNSFVMLEYQL